LSSSHLPVVRALVLCGALCVACATTPAPPASPDPATDPAPAGTPGPASTGSPQTFAEQVALGQTLFAQSCAECHGSAGQGDTAPRLVGLKEGALPLEPPADRKLRKERFVTVADVATFAVTHMPPKKVGSLSAEQAWSIVAFDLKANGIDLGQKLTPELAQTLTIPR
jgi:mono/diheme cytochrome c family protein